MKRSTFLLAASALIAGLSAAAPQVAQGVALIDQELTEWDVTDPDLQSGLSAADHVTLMNFIGTPPAPTGFVKTTDNWVRVTFKGYINQGSGLPELSAKIREEISEIESLDISVDGVVIHTASRSGGGATFLNRGAYTYVTISFEADLFQSTSGILTWYDALGVPSGSAEVEQ